MEAFRQAVVNTLERRLFYIPSFKIYRGVAGLYDYGPPGCAVESNVLAFWRQHFVLEENMLEVDCPCVTPEVVLKASGHVDKFTDLMVKDEKTGTCYRADHLLKDYCKEKLEKEPNLSAEKTEELKHVLATLDDLSVLELGDKIKGYGITARDTKSALSDPYPFRRALLSTIPRMLSSNPASHAIYRPVLGSFSRFYSSNGTAKSINIDLSSEESKRSLFNSLLYRSKQRGFLELDLILGKWVEDHIYSMDESGIKNLVHILDLENPDLWKWLTDQEKPPEAVNLNPVFLALREKVINNLNSHAAPETRAAPGQPWTRGWDDFNKGREAPITGNQ